MLSTIHFHDILFELSNSDRYNILDSLKRENSTVSKIARQLSITTQEASRHLSRLSEADLTYKLPSGEYTLSNYGTTILEASSHLLFITSNREYFKEHSITNLPPRFISRLTELKNNRLISDVMVVFANIERIIEEANEYIWRLTDRYNMMSLPKLEKATERGVQFKLMQTKSFKYPPDWPGPWVILRDARMKGRFDVRRSIEANSFLAMNEKEVAILAFPINDNVFNYRGFTSKDPMFNNWCKEVFEQYWEKAETVG